MATEYISKAWKVYRKNYLSFIASELITGLMAMVILALGLVIFLGSVLPMVNWEMIVNTTDEEIVKQYFMELIEIPGFLSSLGTGIMGFGISVFLAILVSAYLKIGQVGMAYESLKRRTKLGTMFKVSRKLGLRWIGTYFLLFIIGLITLIPMVIVGVLTLGLGLFAILLVVPVLTLIAPAMVVDNASPVGSIKKAFGVAKRNYLNLFAIWLIYTVGSVLISLLGSWLSIVPAVGGLINMTTSLFVAFVISPMIKISFVGYYVKNRKKGRKGI